MSKICTDIEWVDIDTRECHCYNCCLFDNGCKDISLCKRPRNTYKGFYVEKEKMIWYIQEDNYYVNRK